MTQPRGQIVPIPTYTYDPATNPKSPSYDPSHNNTGHITGTKTPPATKE